MKNKGQYKVNVILADTHLPWEDKALYPVVKDLIKEIQPDQITHLGDLFDGYSVSSFDKDPRKDQTLAKELKRAKDELLWYQNHSKEPINYAVGNHEFRLEKYLVRKAPELIGTIGASLDEQLGLTANGYNWAQYGDILKGDGNVWYAHGEPARNQSSASAKANFDKEGVNMLIGHSHRIGSFYKTTRQEVRRVFEVGCLCDRNQGYICGTANWQQGFGVANHFEDGSFLYQQIEVQNGRFIYNGKVYKV